jgi:hypothetical protein
MTKRAIFILLLLVFCANSNAFDVVYTPIDKALNAGEVVFVGFVDSASVVNKTVGVIQVRASILVEECLLGESCKKGSTIAVDYLTQTSVGTSLPVKLFIGGQVIFILKKQLMESPYKFDSDINGGTDFAFACNAFPYSVFDEHSRFKCRDSVTGRESELLSLKAVENMLLNP